MSSVRRSSALGSPDAHQALSLAARSAACIGSSSRLGRTHRSGRVRSGRAGGTELTPAGGTNLPRRPARPCATIGAMRSATDTRFDRWGLEMDERARANATPDAAARARQRSRARLGFAELCWLALVVAAASALSVHLA